MGKSTFVPARMGWVAGILLSVMCVLGMVACGGGASTFPGAGNSINGQVPWPPAEARTASGVLGLTGAEYAQKNEGSTVSGTALGLVVENGMGWGVYTFTGLAAGDLLANVQVDAVEDAAGGGGAVLFVGLANYDRGAWDWHQMGTAAFDYDVTDGADFVSPGKSASIAVVYCGDATAAVNTVAIETVFDGLMPPENLAGAAAIGQVGLSWDTVDGAAGYLVERDTAVNFLSGTVITDEPVATAEYTDTTVLADTMYYYRVIAVNSETQSDPSSYIDIHVPKADLPVPQNLHVSERGMDYLKLDWEWSDSNPASFDIFVTDTPDALLGAAYFSMPGFMRTVTVDGLQPSTTVYVRVAACNASGWHGPATDDLQASTIAIWEWTEPQTIGAGGSPLSVCETQTGFALAYASTEGAGVAKYDGAAWNTEQIAALQVGTYMDIVESPQHKLVAVIHEGLADDFYGAFETESGWVSGLIHGNGADTEGHPISGVFCGVASGSSEVIAWHLDQTGSLWRAYRADLETSSWSDDFTMPGSLSDAMSIAFNGEDAAGFYFHDSKLQYGTEAGSWAFSDALESSGDGIGSCVQLFLNGTRWEAIALSNTDSTWYYLTNAASPWTTEAIGAVSVLGFAYTQPVLMGNEPAYCTYHTSHGWKFNERKSDWLLQPMNDATADMTSAGALVLVDGVPYFIFADLSDGNLKYLTGVAPE